MDWLRQTSALRQLFFSHGHSGGAPCRDEQHNRLINTSGGYGLAHATDGTSRETQKVIVRRTIVAGAHVLHEYVNLLTRQVIQHGEVELHGCAYLWPACADGGHWRHVCYTVRVFPALSEFHGVILIAGRDVVGVAHNVCSCFSTPCLLMRWYCSANILFAREMRVAAAFGEIFRMVAIS